MTKEAYYKVYRESLEKYQSMSSRRKSTKKEFYKDSKVKNTLEDNEEYIKPDKFRFVVIERTAEHVEKSEIIEIGNSYYCKKNDDDWKNSKSGCIDGWASGLQNVVSSKYFTNEVKENKKNVRLYREFITYKNTFSPDKDKEGLSYFESKLWVSEDGYILREEITDGLLESNNIYSKEINIYEYNPADLKIEAPIK